MSDIRKYINLIESAMRVDESFKTAQEKFSEVNNNEQEVKEYLDKFKDLAKRNIIKGQDKDIGKWIKAGWDKFKDLVDNKKSLVSDKQNKKNIKNVEAIKAFEDDDVLVIIPLSHRSSCYYGSGTKWCTTSNDSAEWDSYFGVDEYTVFYIIDKNTGDKFAALIDDDEGELYFDAKDDVLDYLEFLSATPTVINDQNLEKWKSQHYEQIKQAQSDNAANE